MYSRGIGASILSLSLVVLIAIPGCYQQNPFEEGGKNAQYEVKEALAFISLEAERSTVSVGDQIEVRADVAGDRLVFYWHANRGRIEGSGPDVQYVADHCCSDEVTITCTVRDGAGNEQARSIEVLIR